MPDQQAMGLYYHQDYLHVRAVRTCEHAFPQGVQVDPNLRRLLARRCQNEQLQRIYGTAWADKKQLAAYILRIEEAEKRDHRKLGKQLGLFHMQEEAPGLVFWHPKGWQIWQVVEQYMRQVYRQSGYDEVKCPQILDKSLWEKTGHWQNYRENMFITSSESRDYALKPMNCPGHVLVYNHGLHSIGIADRYGEFGSCTRNEPSGALHGLMRVRGLSRTTAIFSVPKNRSRPK